MKNALAIFIRVLITILFIVATVDYSSYGKEPNNYFILSFIGLCFVYIIGKLEGFLND